LSITSQHELVVRGTHRHAANWIKLGLGLLLIGSAVVLGRDFGHHLPAIEESIESQGPWGYVTYVLAVVVLTSAFVPDTVFAVMAGMLFGVVWGTGIMTAACRLTATLDFGLGRFFLQQAVRQWLARKPHLAAIERAVERQGFRFQFLLRLTPINPVTVSYVLGATNTRYPPCLVACLGLVPSLFVEVYFGYVAKHVAKISGKATEHSTLQSAVTIAGLLICVVVLVYVVRVARRALAECET
jgi:uncharacterized membrane protein YdjX (TVP38/TMEM64 family)